METSARRRRTVGGLVKREKRVKEQQLPELRAKR
jgi:hypothetical protein